MMIKQMAAVLTIGGLLLTGGCDKKATAPVQAPLPQVTVKPVNLKPHPVYSVLTGRVHPLETAAIRPQVNGILLKRRFTEGARVKAGDVLYTIDPAPYEAAVKEKTARLAAARAQFTLAEREARRVSGLFDARAASAADKDAAVAARLDAQARLRGAQADLKAARIDLSRTRITSPIDGTVGRNEFSEGTLVRAFQPEPLTTVRRLDTVKVDLVRPAEEIMQLNEAFAKGLLENDAASSTTVRLTFADGTDYAPSGVVRYNGVSVAQATSSVDLSVEFPNPDGVLFPGLFVRVLFLEGVQPKSALVADAVMQHSPRGVPFVYLLDADNKVLRREVKAVQMPSGRWLVSRGLAEGDRMIVDGIDRVREGLGVTIKP